MLDVIRPNDVRYALARHTYTATGSPAAVVRVRNTEEIPLALAFARAEGGPLSVRSGGHGISRPSTNVGGTVIDLGELNHIEHLGGTRVRVGAGARWGDVARRLQPWDLAITSGDSGDVGVGGLATAGGLGLLGRLQGLTVDRIRAAEVITADGLHRRIDEAHDPDLFWALRGAGADVGIAASFEFDAGTTATVAHATLSYHLGDTGDFLQRWGDAVEAAPWTVSAFLYLGSGLALATVVAATDDPAAASRALAPFAELPGMVDVNARIVPYASVVATAGGAHTGQQSARTRTGLINHLDAPTSRAIATLVPAVDMVQIRSAGGAINDVPAAATAYAHRHQNFSVTAMSSGARHAFDTAWSPMAPLLDGTYLSFESDQGPDALARAFPPATLARLRLIASRWDPSGLLSPGFA